MLYYVVMLYIESFSVLGSSINKILREDLTLIPGFKTSLSQLRNE